MCCGITVVLKSIIINIGKRRNKFPNDLRSESLVWHYKLTRPLSNKIFHSHWRFSQLLYEFLKPFVALLQRTSGKTNCFQKNYADQTLLLEELFEDYYYNHNLIHQYDQARRINKENVWLQWLSFEAYSYFISWFFLLD